MSVPEQQWVFRDTERVLRPARRVLLCHVDDAVPPRDLVVRRRGSGADPVLFGEPIWLDDGSRHPVALDEEVAAAADEEPGEYDPPGVTEDVGRWQLTGGAVGTTVPLGVPVGLLNEAAGDHLVAAPVQAGPGLAWWGAVRLAPDGSDPFRGRPPLPVPSALRTVVGIPAQVELPAVLLPDAPPGRLRARLDPQVATAVSAHLSRRRSTRLDVVSQVLAKLPVPGGDERLPPPGTRILLTGALVDDEVAGVFAVDPLDGIAWASGPDGVPLQALPNDAAWPELSVVWSAVAYPALTTDERVYARSARPVTWYLPLPKRDGEPGSTTTFSPTLVRSNAAGGGPVPASPGGRLGAATIVRHPRDGWRALRLPVAQPDHGVDLPPIVGCAVRVHLGRASQRR